MTVVDVLGCAYLRGFAIVEGEDKAKAGTDNGNEGEEGKRSKKGPTRLT